MVSACVCTSALHHIPLRQGLSLNLELTFFLARLSEQWTAAIPSPPYTVITSTCGHVHLLCVCWGICTHTDAFTASTFPTELSSQSSGHWTLFKRGLGSYNSITFLWFCILLIEIWFLTWFSVIFISKYNNRTGRLQSCILCTYFHVTSVLACRIYSIDSGLSRLLQSVFCRVHGVLWHRRGNTKQATFNILREDLT